MQDWMKADFEEQVLQLPAVTVLIAHCEWSSTDLPKHTLFNGIVSMLFDAKRGDYNDVVSNTPGFLDLKEELIQFLRKVRVEEPVGLRRNGGCLFDPSNARVWVRRPTTTRPRWEK